MAALAAGFALDAEAADLAWAPIPSIGNQYWNATVGRYALSNWVDNSVFNSYRKLAAGDFLIFDGTAYLDNTNDFTDLWVRGFRFQAFAGAFTLGGNPVTLGRGSESSITNTVSSRQTFNMGLTVDGTSVWQGGSGGLTFNGAVTVADAHLRLAGGVTIDNTYTKIPGTNIYKNLQVGLNGNGSLRIENGSVVRSMLGEVGANSGSNGLATVTGAGAQWNLSYGAFIGGSGAGTLTVDNKGLVNAGDLVVGVVDGSQGTVKVSGTGSELHVSFATQVGDSGVGRLTIEGGSVGRSGGAWLGRNSSGNGTVTVTGIGSQWNIQSELRVGHGGTGTLNIENGGMVSNSDGYVGVSAGSNGAVKVTGANSQWNNTFNLYVGQAGTGSLHILDSGKVTAPQLTIGNKGTVTLDGGTLQVASGSMSSGGIFNWIKGTLGLASDASIGTGLLASTTTVGSGKTLQVKGGLTIDKGPLNIANGGVVSSYMGLVGANAGGSGTVTVTVTGANAQWNNAAALFIGQTGTGTLSILDSGKVTSSFLSIGSKGTVNLDGGTLQVASGYMAAGGSFNWIKGTLGFTDDTSIGAGLLASTTTVGSGKTLQVNGGLTIDSGSLNIASGGVVSNSWAALGSEDGSSGIANVSGAGARWMSTSDLYVGRDGTGTLTIDNGGLVSSFTGQVGTNAGGSGTVKVTGGNSQWNNAALLSIGDKGAGTLSILDSGKVTASHMNIGSKGTVNLDGGTLQVTSASIFSGGIFNWTKGTLGLNGDNKIGTGLLASTTTVGSGKTLKVDGHLTNDNGILKIDNGGVVSSAQGAIGYSPGSSGTVTLTGANSSWRNAGDLSVGYAGTGSLNVLAGAEVSSVDGYIGREGSFGSLAMVSGAGSKWAASGTLYVNNGSLNVGNGGVASSQSAFVGAYAGRTGIVTVTGAGSQWNNTAALYVGLAGAGTLSIENGGLVSSAGGAIGAAPGSSGTVTVTGANSTWRDTGDLGVGHGGTAVLSILDFGRVTTQALRIGTQGTLNLGQGARLSTVNGTINNNTVHFTGDSSIAGRFTNNGSVVGSAGTLRFDNDVSGAGRYAGDIQFNAHYRPGNSPAAVDFGGGNVTFGSDSVLDIEVFGAAPGTQYDQLLHIHTLTFNGTLNLIFSDGYVPAPGSLLTLFDFASFSGSLSADHITVSGYDKRLLDFSRLGTDGSLSVTAVPEPAHWALMLAGLVGLVWKTRRQRAAHAMA